MGAGAASLGAGSDASGVPPGSTAPAAEATLPTLTATSTSVGLGVGRSLLSLSIQSRRRKRAWQATVTKMARAPRRGAAGSVCGIGLIGLMQARSRRVSLRRP